jgi:hypothetical protein
MVLTDERGALCVDACRPTDWNRFLKANALHQLKAPTGASAFRWLWVNQVETGVGSVPKLGFVEVTVATDGSGLLRSIWNKTPVEVSAADLSPFLHELLETEFNVMPEQDASRGA